MRSKLAVLMFVGVLFSLPYALGQTDSRPESAAENRELRREIIELKKRMAELEARLVRLETRVQHPGGGVRIKQRDPDHGSYLRFPLDVERAMMLPQKVPFKWEQPQPPTIERLPESGPGALDGEPRLEGLNPDTELVPGALQPLERVQPQQ